LAREADLLVVNHALLMHDLLAEHSLMGAYDHLVVDEAHRLPEVALESHAVKCDRLRLHIVAELLGPAVAPGQRPRLLHELSEQLAALGAPGIAMTTVLDDLGASIQSCFRSYQQWWTAVGRCFDTSLAAEHRPVGRIRVYNQAEAFGPVRSETQALLAAAATAGASYANVSQHAERLPELPPGTEENLATLAQIGHLLDQLQRDVRFLTEGSEEDWVVWLELGPRSGLQILGATMLESSRLLRDYWFGSGLYPIMTSATLAVGEDFSFMLTELGLSRWQPATQISLVASPFHYDRQVLILAPVEFPTPDHPTFGAAVTGVLETIQRGIPRTAMALFTSYQLLRQVAAALSDEIPERGGASEELRFAGETCGTTLLLQQSRGGATSSLVEQFRDASQALLLGTMTFWEGVDFPGSDLEILVVTKLPFLVPNDPWVEARCGRIQAAGEDPFATFMVRDAVLRLRQGLGRLIRRSDDRGVIVLLDSRLHSRNYGTTFLNALPTSPRYFHHNEELAELMTNFFAGATDQAMG
jgi:ATP-dependent DNA helicase DinG